MKKALALSSFFFLFVFAFGGTSFGQHWHVERSKDKLTDQESVIFENISSSGRNAFGNRILLFISCSAGNYPIIGVNWRTVLDADSSEEERAVAELYEYPHAATVEYRIDDSSISSYPWATNKDMNITRYLDGAKKGHRSFIMQLMRGKRLIIRVKPFAQPLITAEFMIDGLKTAMDPFFDDCGMSETAALSTQPNGAKRQAVTAWSAIAAGGWHSVGLKRDGSLWAWGGNRNGQVATRPAQIKFPSGSAIGATWKTAAAGFLDTLALRSDGTLWAWGGNSLGELGTKSSELCSGEPCGTTLVNIPIPAGSADGDTWSSIAAGWFHSLALRSDGTLWSWGDNALGELGASSHDSCTTSGRVYPCSTTPIKVALPTAGPADATWTAIAAGRSYSLGLRSNGTLWSWGVNDQGQLGDGTTINRSMPVEVTSPDDAHGKGNWIAVAAGDGHSLALRSGGTLWAWGYNGDGQLGAPTTNSCGGHSCSTTPLPVPLPAGGPSGAVWQAIFAGGSDSFALRSDGTLWAWGDNDSGQLGTISNDTCGDDRCSKKPIEVPLPRTSPTGAAWRAVAAGSFGFTLALRSDGTLWVWGSNTLGELGIDTTTDEQVPVQVK